MTNFEQILIRTALASCSTISLFGAIYSLVLARKQTGVVTKPDYQFFSAVGDMDILAHLYLAQVALFGAMADHY